MNIQLVWKHRQPAVPWDGEQPEVTQYFRTEAEAYRFLNDRRRDPDFVFVSYSKFSQELKYSHHNISGVHLRDTDACCIKCDAVGGFGSACQPQVYDP